jgi:alpha-N-arabinofuranosidase
MPTFGEWEATVLDHTYDQVDLISLHAYYQQRDGDLGSFLASSMDMESFIESVIATADHIGTKNGSRKRIDLSFDEWNVWYLSRFRNEGAPPGWPQAPRLLEDHYNVTDAVVVGNLLISLLRHSDRVAVACQAQLVNVIAPIFTEPGGKAWRQTIFHPFAQTSRHASGNVLRLDVDAPTYETSRFCDVPVVDAVATHDDRGTVLFAVNRSVDSGVRLDVDSRPLGPVEVVECLELADADRFAQNSAARPERVRPRAVAVDRPGDDGMLALRLPPVSWTMLRLGQQAG